jgi:Rrf2 family transcriptional regulator, iron-sulfur cluster assembly transcription factor
LKFWEKVFRRHFFALIQIPCPEKCIKVILIYKGSLWMRTNFSGYIIKRFLRSIWILVKLTTRGRYSVKALLDLSLQPGYGPASVQSIAQRQALPAPYLEKLLIAMRQAGLVVSLRGAQGGYRLAKKPSQIFVGDILAAVGESITEDSNAAITEAISLRERSANEVVRSRSKNSIAFSANCEQVGAEVASAPSVAGRGATKKNNSSAELMLEDPQLAADWVMISLWQRLQIKMQTAVDSISLADLYYDARSWQASQREESNYTV